MLEPNDIVFERLGKGHKTGFDHNHSNLFSLQALIKSLNKSANL